MLHCKRERNGPSFLKKETKATHLVLGPKSVEPRDQTFLRDFISRYRDRLQEKYANADFQVYRIEEAPLKKLVQVMPEDYRQMPDP